MLPVEEIHPYPSDHCSYHRDTDTKKPRVNSPTMHSDGSSRSHIYIMETEATEAPHTTATGSPFPVIVDQYAGSVRLHPVVDDHQSEWIVPPVSSGSPKVRTSLRDGGMLGGALGHTEHILLPTHR